MTASHEPHSCMISPTNRELSFDVEDGNFLSKVSLLEGSFNVVIKSAKRPIRELSRAH